MSCHVATAMLLAGCLLGFAQDVKSPPAPLTVTLKDALALAEKNDPGVLAAASDASSANEDRKQARASLLPSFSGRSEYLGTQGNGKLSESRFVTNDGVHVYRDWAVMHQDLSPGALSGVGVQRASAAGSFGASKAGDCAARAGCNGDEKFLRVDCGGAEIRDGADWFGASAQISEYQSGSRKGQGSGA